MTSEKNRETTSLVQNPEKQTAILNFITQSFYCSPEDSEELKAAVILANDNSSTTPNADRWFLEGVFAVLRHLTNNGDSNERPLQHD